MFSLSQLLDNELPLSEMTKKKTTTTTTTTTTTKKQKQNTKNKKQKNPQLVTAFHLNCSSLQEGYLQTATTSVNFDGTRRRKRDVY